MFKILSLVLVLISLYEIEPAKILGIFIVPVISQQTASQPLWRELSLRGHDITLLTLNPINDSTLVNLTEINLSSLYNVLLKKDISQLLRKDLSVTTWTKLSYEIYLKFLFNNFLEMPEVQSLIRDSSATFDLVLVQNEIFGTFTFGHVFNCPVIGVTPLMLPSLLSNPIGNAWHPVIKPSNLLQLKDMSYFSSRVYSFWYDIWLNINYALYINSDLTWTSKKKINENLPEFGTILKKNYIQIANKNPIIVPVYADIPSVADYSSIHIKSKQEMSLPKGLKYQLDSAKKGFIYINLGTFIKSTSLSQQVIQAIIEVFSELPYTVVWKWENNTLHNKPENIIIRKYYPQQEVLAHPNIKLFLTQGGVFSITEALTYGVPIIGIPLYFDQRANVLRAVQNGVGKIIECDYLTKENLKLEILELLENPKYENRAKELSKIMQDVANPPTKNVVWWIEYVIRHKGMPYFRSAAADIPWYQYLLLDVISCLLVIGSSLTFIFTKLVYLMKTIVKYDLLKLNIGKYVSRIKSVYDKFQLQL